MIGCDSKNGYPKDMCPKEDYVLKIGTILGIPRGGGTSLRRCECLPCGGG